LVASSTLVLVCYDNAIIVTTAATLHKAGITNVQTSAQAAEALKAGGGRVRARLPSIAKGLIWFECGADTTVGGSRVREEQDLNG
jgi:hypothetical protein